MAGKFEIECKYHVGCGSTWEPLPDDNEFETVAEAEEMIESLRKMPEWKNAELRVKPIKYID